MIRLSEQTLFADRYLFQRLLGRGGFSEVWLAIDKVTNLEIAVKVYAPGQGMDSDGMKDFCKELSQVYNLNHTNLLKPQHVDSWEGMPYLVMTYCPKGSCHRLIGTMNEEQIWKMLHDVSAGLAYLHEQGIIHQDIKPDNILVDPMGNYVITDFGISVQARSTLRKSMNIASGSGTTAYMGPERFSKDPTPLKASDIWSLGATAYELLTGNAPFGEIGGGLQKGGADLPTIKQSISSELRMVLAKMLSLETWDRPTAEQLVKWTENPQKTDFSSENIKSINTVSQTSTPIQSNISRKKGIIGMLIAIFLLLGCGVAWWIHTENVAKDLKKAQEEQERIERCIKIQLEISKTCDKYIADLNERNFLDKLDLVVEEMRKLERFEEDSPCAPDLKRAHSQEKMKMFMGKLSDIKGNLANALETTFAEFDKNGMVYQLALRKLKRIDEVFNDIDNSANKSAKDIHLSSDEF